MSFSSEMVCFPKQCKEARKWVVKDRTTDGHGTRMFLADTPSDVKTDPSGSFYLSFSFFLCVYNLLESFLCSLPFSFRSFLLLFFPKDFYFYYFYWSSLCIPSNMISDVDDFISTTLQFVFCLVFVFILTSFGVNKNLMTFSYFCTCWLYVLLL